MTDPVQLQKDIEHLRLLSIFHYVMAGFSVLFSCIPGIYLVLGIAMLVGSQSQTAKDPPPAAVGIFFIIIAIVLILLIFLSAFLTFLGGRFLQRRKSRVFCIIVAIFLIVSMNMFAIALGVFSLIVLMRPSVVELFEREKQLQPN